MVSVLLFILAAITLAVTLWDFETKRKRHRDYYKNENLYSDAWKPIGGKKLKRVNWRLLFQSKSERRRDYYRNEYLKSDAWKRKRYVVLKRDNWRCVYCGAPATQVHHKRYARKNIGKEPIEWLVSVCKPCHDSQHNINK